MKSITITPPEGYEVDKNKSTFSKIVFKKIKKELPKKWKDLKEISGWYLDGNGEVRNDIEIHPTIEANKDIFATKEQAEAAIAMAQLSQLLKVYNDGWQPDFTKPNENKYLIILHGNRVQIEHWNTLDHFLTFKTKKIAQQFLENFRDLIEQAKPLL